MSGKAIYMGITRAREHVYAEIRLEIKNGDHTLIDHTDIGPAESLGIMWTVVKDFKGFDLLDPDFNDPKVDRRTVGAGQVAPEDRRVVAPHGRSISRADRAFVEETWLDWHLNDMRAGCVHLDGENGHTPTYKVPDVLPASKYGSDLTSWKLDNLVCPVTGYKWGSRWLTARIPLAVTRQLKQIMEANR